MKHEIATTLPAVRRLAAPWSDLCARTENDNPFLTPEWNLPWMECVSGQEPFLIVAGDADRLEAVIPLVLRRRGGFRILSFVEGNDFGYVWDGDMKLAAQAIAEAMKASSNSWDLAVLADLLRDEPTTVALRDACIAAGLACVVEETHRYPYVDHGGDIARYQEQLPTKVLNQVERRRRRLEALGAVEFLRFSDVAEAQSELPEILRIHNLRWAERNDTSAFPDPERMSAMEQATHNLASAGYLSLDVLAVDGVHIAFSYGIMCNRRLVHYRASYDPAYSAYGPSQILLHHIIFHYLGCRGASLDLGMGSAPYKEVWATDAGLGLAAVVSQPTARSRVGAHLAQYRVVTKRGLRRFAWLVNFKRVTLGRIKHGVRPRFWWSRGTGFARRARRSLEDRGVFGAAIWFAQRAAWPVVRRSYATLYRRAPGPGRQQSVHGADVQLLRPREVVRFATVALYRPEDVVRRLHEGANCALLSVDGEIVAWGWFRVGGDVYLPQLGRQLRFAADQVYIYDCRTTGRHRGRGYFPILLEWIMSENQGKTGLLLVDKGNSASARSIAKAGFQPTTELSQWTWLPSWWRRPPLEIRVADQ